MLNMLKNFKRKDWILISFSLLFLLFEVIFDLKIPDIMTDITTKLQQKEINFRDIVITGIEMLLFTIFGVISVCISSLIMSRVSSGFIANIRKKLFFKAQDLSLNEISKFSIPSLITRLTKDIDNVELFLVDGLLAFVKAPLMFVIIIGKLLNKNFIWCIITFFCVLIIIVVFIVALKLCYEKYIKIQGLIDELSSVFRENLTGMYSIRAFNYEKIRGKKFDQKNQEYVKTTQFVNTAVSLVNTFITSIMYSMIIIVYFTGANIINNAGEHEKMVIFSDMMVYATYVMMLITTIILVMLVVISFPQAMVSVGRIYAVLNEENSIVSGNLLNINDIESIEFRNVNFRYSGSSDDAVFDISFEVHRGETIAITGPTGSGKTTLLNLLMRLYDVKSGEVLINGINIKEYSLECLHKLFGYAPQKNFLFQGSVADNISYGSCDMGKQHIQTVCHIACVDEFIAKNPKGIESEILREGSNLSGGQKQRISIARAIYKKPDVIVLDDSFSALDYKTDRTIRSRLRDTYNNAIQVIVSQRISTILNADKIIVLNEGTIVGYGTHDSLLETCSIYKKFYDIQLLGGGVVD